MTFSADPNYRGVGTDCEMNCSWDEIRKQFDDERNDYRKRRQAFLQKTKVCDEVVLLTEAMIELDYYPLFVNSMWHYERYQGKEAIDKKALMKELNEVADKYFNTGLYFDSHFRFIASAYIPAARFATETNTKTNYLDWIHETDFVDLAKKVVKTDIVRDFMFTVLAGDMLVQRDLDNFEKYSVHVNNDYLFDRLMQEYRVTQTKMQNPETISAYILGNMKEFMNNISFDDHNFLANKTAKNHGKVHVINIGAAWCAPCKPVLEQLGTLMKEYAGKDVYFSFICVSQDNKGTRVLYQEKGIDDTTVHFATEDEWKFLQSHFAPMGLPYGILVNRKGVIVDYGTHVRPSGMLREKINLLLEQDKLIK